MSGEKLRLLIAAFATELWCGDINFVFLQGSAPNDKMLWIVL